MNEELSRFYDNQFAMMGTHGWADFMADCEKVKAQYSDISTVTDTQQLFFRKGQLDILNWVLNRRQAHKDTFDQLQEDSDAPNV